MRYLLVRSLVLGLTAGVLAAVAGAQKPIYKLPGHLPSGYLGVSVSGAGDVDGDGVPDIIAGSPHPSFPLGGHARVFSGATGGVLFDVLSIQSNADFGYAVASAGDVDGDGHADLLIGAPESDSTAYNEGRVFVMSGADGSVIYSIAGQKLGEKLGQSVAGGFDLSGDGIPDFAAGGYYVEVVVRVFSGLDGTQLYEVKGPVGAPIGYSLCMLLDTDGDGAAELVTGNLVDSVTVLSGKNGSRKFLVQGTSGDWFGKSVARTGDVNGDGVDDFVVGAPFNNEAATSAGRVDIRSGFDGSLLLKVYGNKYNRLGWSVGGTGDVDGDLVPDIIAGTQQAAGIARVFSGASGAILYDLSSTDIDSAFGYSVAGVEDLNGDLRGDFAVGFGTDDTYGPDFGGVWVYLGGTPGPTVYCTAKVNSLGCIPRINWTGLLSLSIADNFHVTAGQVLNNQLGILAWSTGPDSKPFFNGTLCLKPPVIRAPAQLSGGNPPPSDCSGMFDFHFTQAYAAQFGLPAGTDLYAQYWSRDPNHPDGTGVGLTDALSFPVLP